MMNWFTLAWPQLGLQHARLVGSSGLSRCSGIALLHGAGPVQVSSTDEVNPSFTYRDKGTSNKRHLLCGCKLLVFAGGSHNAV